MPTCDIHALGTSSLPFATWHRIVSTWLYTYSIRTTVGGGEEDLHGIVRGEPSHGGEEERAACSARHMWVPQGICSGEESFAVHVTGAAHKLLMTDACDKRE